MNYSETVCKKLNVLFFASLRVIEPVLVLVSYIFNVRQCWSVGVFGCTCLLLRITTLPGDAQTTSQTRGCPWQLQARRGYGAIAARFRSFYFHFFFIKENHLN